jgi:hypothetical protein
MFDSGFDESVIAPDSELHRRLLPMLQHMIDLGERHMEQRFEFWDQVDEHMMLYVDLRRGARRGDWTEDPKKREMPFDRAFAIPATYVSLLTRVGQEYGVMSATEPFLHYEPREGGDLYGARALEALGKYGAEMTENELQTWQAFLDAEKYGLCIWYDTFCEKIKQVVDPRAMQIPSRMLKMLVDSGQMPRDQAQAMVEAALVDRVVAQWSGWRCIDPRRFIPDPAVPITQPQRMRWIGHRDTVNWLDMHDARLSQDRGPWVNVDACRKLRSADADLGSNRDLKGQFDTTSDIRFDSPVLEIRNLQVKVIPSELGLGESNRVQTWWFAIANKDVICRCHKSRYPLDEYTYSTAAPDPDMHAAFTPGFGEQAIGQQRVVDWLIAAMVANKRRIVNTRSIVNDNLVDMITYRRNEPGGIVTMTQQGKALHERGVMPIDAMYSQLKIDDVTGGHMQLAQAIMQDMQRLAATPPPIEGMPLATKRTLGEVNQITQSASMRIGTTAELIDRQLVRPMAKRLVANEIEFRTIETFVRLTGELQAKLAMDALVVKPGEIHGNYDYVGRTPTMARDPARSAALWGSLLQVLMSAGPMAMQPDSEGNIINIHQVFKEFIRQQGVNYFDQFYMPAPQQGPQVLPPEEIDRQVQAGNLVPFEAKG